MENKVIIKVPATTANIGPGFDSFGCALALYNIFTFELIGKALEFVCVDEPYCNMDNLAYQAYCAAMAKMNLPVEEGLRITINSQIPICRGLGSSASLLVAGVAAANELHGRQLSNQQILEIATELEGHPDNIAPAIFGGLTASMMANGKPYTVQYAVSPNVHPVAIIPDFELSTAKSRAVLPEMVPFHDAVFNVSHAAILLRALESGDAELIACALEDRLHQDYRKSLIDHYTEVCDSALELGAATYCISGAGPTQLAIFCDMDKAGGCDANANGADAKVGGCGANANGADAKASGCGAKAGGCGANAIANVHDFVAALKKVLSKDCQNWQVIALDVDNNGLEILNEL